MKFSQRDIRCSPKTKKVEVSTASKPGSNKMQNELLTSSFTKNESSPLPHLLLSLTPFGSTCSQSSSRLSRFVSNSSCLPPPWANISLFHRPIFVLGWNPFKADSSASAGEENGGVVLLAYPTPNEKRRSYDGREVLICRRLRRNVVVGSRQAVGRNAQNDMSSTSHAIAECRWKQ